MRAWGSIRLCALALALGWAVAAPTELRAQAQESSATASLTVDAQLADQGQQLFMQKGCMACHTVGDGKRAGPDLLGVIERRQVDWVKKFLTDTNGMLANDPVAQQLLEEYNYVRMPNMRLSDGEADALIHYIAQKSMQAQGER